ncbi:MAG TPA: glycosyltransferase, partial [Terracidiphilus sp.]|nr:glycosyltransferase [Terracidiphilus sp.]
PVYNVEAYVAEALESIQSQTFSDIEIVVVDDGSTDNTLPIVEQIALSDARIKIVRAPRNLGLPAALNFGLPFCQAPLIARMDGDDIALPTRLEKQFQFLEQNPEIDLVGCATTAIDCSGNPIPGLSVSRKPENEEAVARTMLLGAPCLHIWLARRQVYDALSGYREMECAEDYDFLLRALTAGFHVTNLPEALMKIRTRSGNLSSRLEQRKAHYYIIRLCRERLAYGKDSYSPEAYRKAVKMGKIEGALFRLAISCASRGLRSQNWIASRLLLAASAMISPWQSRYFFDRMRFRILARRSMRLS